MPFTDETLATLMVTKLGATGVTLGLTVASAAIVDAVAETAEILGVAVADEPDQLKLRIVATWLAWRTALGAAVGKIDLKAGTVQLWQSQFFNHIAAMLREAEAQASIYDEVAVVLAGSSTGYVSEMGTANSPYNWAFDEWS